MTCKHDGSLLCRHYVDRICRYTTGVNAATALCKRHVYNLSRQPAQWSDSLVTVAQILTDVANWPRVKAATQVGNIPARAEPCPCMNLQEGVMWVEIF